MVPADWLHVQYGSSLAAGFWTGTGFAEGCLVGALFHSNEPFELQFPSTNLHPFWRCGCSTDVQADTEQTHPVDDSMWGGSMTPASVTACSHGYTDVQGCSPGTQG